MIQCGWSSEINQPQWATAAGDSFWLNFKKNWKLAVLLRDETGCSGGREYLVTGPGVQASPGHPFGKIGPFKHRLSDGNGWPLCPSQDQGLMMIGEIEAP